MNPTSLGRYEIRGELGRGAMGVVYRAHDPVIDRALAIKTVVIPAEVSETDRDLFLKRFFQEARTAGKLLHPNIVVTYDAATDEATGTPFIAMELIEGESLAARVRRDGRLAWKDGLGLVAVLARALDQAHRLGIVHRDIKPANVMLTAEGTPKLTDFGIAKLPAAELTRTGVVLGTPYYMSPEQLRGEAVDGRSDLFSLGALGYTIVTGKRPFEGAELASIASQVLYKSPRSPSEIVEGLPASLEGVLARALMKSPEERYATGEALARDLDAVVEGREPEQAVTPAESTRASAALGTIPSDSAQRAHVSREETPREREPTAVPAGSASTPATTRAGVPEPALERRPTFRSRHLFYIAASAVALVAVLALVYRESIAERMRLREAANAAASGDLEQGEALLESLLQENPELQPATKLLSDVSIELLLPSLPLELTAVHDHRFGDCTGRLVLGDAGVEFRSRDHGTWAWRFEQIVTMDERSVGRLFLETRESAMMGLLDKKNYNFALLGDGLPPDTWKRYERLYRRKVEEGREP